MPSHKWDPVLARALSDAAVELDDGLLPLWSDPIDARIRPSRKPIVGLDSETTTIAVIARRSYGKSTLINALLERELLFADWRQATSFPAYISKGDHDSAVIAFDNGHEERIEVDAKAIAAATKQFASARKVNERTKDARRLTLSLGHFPAPRGVVFVDVAGFDDSYDTLRSAESSGAEVERSEALQRAEALREEALAASDLIIVVLRADVALGHLEKLMLRYLFDLKGPRGVLPVFNVFVDYNDDTDSETLCETARAGFSHARVGDAQVRYAAFLQDELGINPDETFTPVLVAALPALDRQEEGDFGLHNLRSKIAELSAGPNWAGADSRPYAAGRALNQSITFIMNVAELRQRFEDALDANKSINEENEARAAWWADWLDTEAMNALEALCSTYDNHLAGAIASWQQEPGRFWEKSNRLNTAMNAAADRAIAEFITHQIDIYNSNWGDHEVGVDPNLHQDLRRIYASRSHTVLPHDPGFGFFEKLFGEDSEVLQQKVDEFNADVDWEINATMNHWREQRTALRATLEARLPAPAYMEKVAVPPCPVEISAKNFEEALTDFAESGEWDYSPLEAGWRAEPLPPIGSESEEATPDDFEDAMT